MLEICLSRELDVYPTSRSIARKEVSRSRCLHHQVFNYKSLKSQIKNSEELFLHLNARSVVNKADDISEICEELHPALILITETWLDGSCPKGTAVPKGYTIVRKDRSEQGWKKC